MKKTLALLIAVLMVVAMLPMSILTAAAADPAPTADDYFAVYNDGNALVGYYADLAAADAALAEGYTLKLLKDYTATASYAWGAARANSTEPIYYFIDGDDNTVFYEGTDAAAWTFGANCAGEGVLITNITIESLGSEAITISNGTEMILDGVMLASAGHAVVRTVAGASASNPANLYIYGGQFMLACLDGAQANDAVVTNGDAGNVEIYGGVFMNLSDSASEYVLNHTNAAGDFKVYGGMLMATGEQMGFYKPANTAATAGVSLPSMVLPIVKGVTPKLDMDPFELYYTCYASVESDGLLVPTVAPGATVELTEDGNNLVFATNIDADLYAAIQTWARSKAHAAGVSADDYAIEFGTVIVDENMLLAYNGNLETVLTNGAGTVVTATAAELVADANGTRTLLAREEAIAVEDKEARYATFSFIELTIGDNEPEIIFGEFNLAVNSASMASAAASALSDNTDTAIGAYQYPSNMQLQGFNRYTQAEQQVLATYLAHEHSYDFTGDCTDADCIENICTELAESELGMFYAVNGESDYFKLELNADVRYTFDLVDCEADYRIYNESGALCTVANGSFTPAATGTYYLQVTAKTNGIAYVAYAHVHDVDYLGVCSVPGCEDDVSVEVTVGTPANAIVVRGNTYVFNVDLEADVTYSVRAANGTIKLYNAAGEEQVVTDNVFACAESGTYYVVLEATYTGKATVYIIHNHAYDHTGLCAHCGDYLGVQLNNVYTYNTPQRVKVGDQFYLNIRLEAGKTYTITASSYVGSFKLYDAAGVEQALTNGAVFTCEADGVYYLKVNVQTDTSAQIRFEVAHGADCTYNNKGECAFTHADASGAQAAVTCGKTNRTNIQDENTVDATLQAGAKKYFILDYASANVTYRISFNAALSYSFYKADGSALALTATTENGVATVTYSGTSDAAIYLVLENTGDTTVATSITVAHEHVIDHRNQCTVKNTTTGRTPSACSEQREIVTVYENTVKSIVYVAGNVYRYTVPMNEGVEYRIVLANAEATWELKNSAGDTVYSSASADACYIPASTANCYLVVTATADSTENATLLVKGHTHSFNNKGECTGADCDETLNKKVLEAGETYDGYLAAGTHYFNVEMVAGNVYTLTFTADGITYVLYGGENADVAKPLVEGAFTCTESGIYYYVVTVTEDVPAHETYTVEYVGA